MKEQSPFPTFWFEGVEFFDWVESIDDFKILIKNYENILNLESILNAKAHKDDEESYGFYSEYTGNKTLKEFLESRNFDYSSL